MTTIDLNEDGPDPAEVMVSPSSDVTFKNNLSADTIVTGDPGLFPGIGDGLPVPKDDTATTPVSGAGSSGKKQFYYDNQDGTQAVRHGIIDVN